MRLCIASGKGGTGKTTVATNLAFVAAEHGRNVAYVDCDVEEPNGHLFLRPEIADRQPVFRTVPEVDPGLCTHCGLCAEVCQFSAIICIGDQVLEFPDLCHSCGGCRLVCPEGAVREVGRALGQVERGASRGVAFLQGRLNVGEAKSPPLIRAVLAAMSPSDLSIVDAPPGTSCPVVESLRGADFVVLVTEPTPFGLNDLKITVELVRELQRPFGVVLNRSGSADGPTLDYCRGEGIPILGTFPDARAIAEAYARGDLASVVSTVHHARFEHLLARIEEVAGRP